MNLLILLGLKKKNSIHFATEKSKMFNIFSQTRDKLVKLIADQEVHIAEQIDIVTKAQKEIDLTNESISSSKTTIENLEKFIN